MGMKIILDKEIVSELKNWFISYVNTFRYNNYEIQKNIDIKREHSEFSSAKRPERLCLNNSKPINYYSNRIKKTNKKS